MNTLQRILLAARLWRLPANESESAQACCAMNEPVRKDIEEFIVQREAILQTAKPTPSIGKDNQGIMDALVNARKVAVTLARAGHRVLDISIGSRNARLTLNPSPRCELLGGAMIKITRMNGVEEKTMAANIDGVQVEWVIGDNGKRRGRHA